MNAFKTAFTLLALALGTASQAAEPPLKRLSLESLSAEQQAALKGGAVRTKSAAQMSYCYLGGERHSLSVEGEGAQAQFRIDGAGSALRHAGRALVDTREGITAQALNALLAPYGLSARVSLDEAGKRWSVSGTAGLEGILALNRLQESGRVLSASPDWQRDLRKK